MLPYFDNKEFLEKQYSLTPEDVLFFLEYPHIQSQEISFERDAWYCKFGSTNEIIANGFSRFFLMGKLIREYFLIADMRNYACTYREEPKELKEFMEWMRMKDKKFTFPWTKKEYDTTYIFSNKIGFNYFMSMVDVGDDFDMQIRTSPYFIDLLLEFIDSYEFEEVINEKSIKTGLYEDIIGYTNGKRNFGENITLKYNLKDYIYNKRGIHKILSGLEKSKNLKIQNIILKEFTISFILSGFVDFSKSLFDIEDIEKQNDITTNELVFDEDTGKVYLNENLLVQLKIGKNDYKFFHILYLSLGKSVSYDDMKSYIKKGRISATNEQYCHKIKNKLPGKIKSLVQITGNGYMLDIEAKK